MSEELRLAGYRRGVERRRQAKAQMKAECDDILYVLDSTGVYHHHIRIRRVWKAWAIDLMPLAPAGWAPKIAFLSLSLQRKGVPGEAAWEIGAFLCRDREQSWFR